MNALIRLKKTTPALVIAFVLAWFALSPTTQAVVPPPDGGYPGFNTAEGQKALFSLSTGQGNTAVGGFSLFSNAEGNFNTAVGAGTLLSNTAGQNTATGAGALLSSTTAVNNTANGAFALFSNTIGSENTAIGKNALYGNTTGFDNTAIGGSTLVNNTTGTGNIALGFLTGGAVTSADGVICIGAGVPGANVSNTTWMGNVYGVTTQSGITAPIVVSDTGQLGTAASSERFKNNIASMEKTSEAILSLRPVTFHYKTDTKGIPQFGLIAEEVAKVNPALVLPDKDGKPYTVRYEAVNAMLLNEFLKARRQIDAQQKQIDALTAGLQKVSAQIEASKPAPQMVNNP